MDTTPHIIESALLVLFAFLLGCLIGFYIRRFFGGLRPEVPRKNGAVETGSTHATGSKAQKP